jgi:ribose transport system substrate-binding protein
MKQRVSILAAAIAVSAMAIAAGVAAPTASWTGAQANLSKHKAVPKFVAPGPAFDAKAKAGGKTIFIIPASSQVPFV